MSYINMAATMDALAEAVNAVSNRVYSWPAPDVTVPCAVVGYPTEVDFDITYARGSDRAVFPIYFMVGKASERTARDRLSEIIAGATSVKSAVDGDLDGVVQTARVIDCRIEEVAVAAVPYLSATFSVEVYT